MCTAIRIGRYAGRNLDIDRDYGGEVIITPRCYPFELKAEPTLNNHYAIIGMGVVDSGYPLYFDTVNEHGLYAAGLNYVGYAKYHAVNKDKTNLAPYELIPYILSRCKTVREAKQKLGQINLVDIPFSSDLPLAQLHFFLADRECSIVVEPDEDGLNVYDNPTDVLTNSPPFPLQTFNLSNYMSLSPEQPKNNLSDSLPLNKYSNGMGALGMPGDLSSASRFVRVAFHRANYRGAGLCAIFHLLGTVAMPDGSVKTDVGFERTEYVSAVDLDNLIYCYRHYDSLNAYAIKPLEENLNGISLTRRIIEKEKEPFF